MKTILLTIILFISIFGQAQVKKNWRLYPDNQNKQEELQLAHRADSTTKKLNFDSPEGNVSINQPKEIDTLTNKLRTNPYILGYTVQLEVSQQTSKIRDARYRLLKIKPDAPIEENYAAPNTYLYGGAFYTRTDAYEFKNAIKEYFPNAIVISRKLPLPPLATK